MTANKKFRFGPISLAFIAILAAALAIASGSGFFVNDTMRGIVTINTNVVDVYDPDSGNKLHATSGSLDADADLDFGSLAGMTTGIDVATTTTAGLSGNIISFRGTNTVGATGDILWNYAKQHDDAGSEIPVMRWGYQLADATHGATSGRVIIQVYYHGDWVTSEILDDSGFSFGLPALFSGLCQFTNAAYIKTNGGVALTDNAGNFDVFALSSGQMIVGSDSGNTPLIASTNYGVSTYLTLAIPTSCGYYDWTVGTDCLTALISGKVAHLPLTFIPGTTVTGLRIKGGGTDASTGYDYAIRSRNENSTTPTYANVSGATGTVLVNGGATVTTVALGGSSFTTLDQYSYELLLTSNVNTAKTASIYAVSILTGERKL